MTKEQATREALELALEALKECRRDPRLKYEHPTYDKTITAIKEALAQPEHTTEYKRGYADAMNWKVQNHLEHLPTAQPEQEPTPTPNEGFEGSIRIFLKKSDGQWERLEKLEQMHEYNKQQWAQPEQELTNLERHERNVQQLFGTPQPKEPEHIVDVNKMVAQPKARSKT